MEQEGTGDETSRTTIYVSLTCVLHPSLQLTSSFPNDRAMSCRAISHLVFESPSVELLMSQRLVKKVAPLLVDMTMAVREAAAGALRYGGDTKIIKCDIFAFLILPLQYRNLSVSQSGELCEQMVKEDVMSPLSVMLKEVGTLSPFPGPPHTLELFL